MALKAKHVVWLGVCVGMIGAVSSPVHNASTCDDLADLTDVLALQAARRSARALGLASWYSETDPGVRRRTASGKRFDSNKLWAASWDYPFGTRLKVTSLKTGRSVVVVVEDRGPARHLNRKVDLTRRAFSRIARLGDGLIEVEIIPVPD